MSLVASLSLEDNEMVCFVGAGGKTTLLLELGYELANAGRSVLLGTTTRMGTDQVPSWATPGDVSSVDSTISFLVEVEDGAKIIGSSPEVFDSALDRFDYVLVEADGARRRLIKAPAEHEPVIPSRCTTAVVVAGVEAIGRPMGEVAHRPELVERVVGLSPDEPVTAEAVAKLLTSDSGGLARIPESARVVVALTGTSDDKTGVVEAVSGHPRIDRVIVAPEVEARPSRDGQMPTMS